jgi:hypothetical protein
MEGFIIGGVVLAAILFFQSQDQETGTGAYAPVRVDSNDDGAADAFTASSSVSLFEHSSLSSDDDWPTSSVMDDSPVTGSYGSGIRMDTDRWTDPTYAYEPDNIYHGTPIDPTYHDDSFSSSDDSCSNLFDDSCSSSSGYDDSFSSSSFDDSFSSSSFDDSFSSSSSFDD